MREGTDLGFDVHVNVMTWTLALVCLWRILEVGTHMRWTAVDWMVGALIPLWILYLEVVGMRRRAALADDWH